MDSLIIVTIVFGAPMLLGGILYAVEAGKNSMTEYLQRRAVNKRLDNLHR